MRRRGERKKTKTGQDGQSLESMMVSYKEARANGDRDEESRWANQIGHLFKDRGEYVEALRWFRLDYDIASGRKASGSIQPQNLMPTCQSMGEIHHRLRNFDEALIYQERHYALAIEAEDLLEQQRASTQLHRTYMEMYEHEEEDKGESVVTLVEKCVKYMTVSMDLAKRLHDRPPSRNSPSFFREVADAYNNMGLMRMVFEDFKQAEKCFFRALKICDEEEVAENDDSRSRIHHNLGRLYLERREWQKAKDHMNKDIMICNLLKHPQGEAKGLINLGQLSFKRQNYDDALRIFKSALTLAKSLEDEDALVADITNNIKVVKEAMEQTKELSTGLQQLLKLQRNVESHRGKSSEREHLMKEYKLLIELLNQAQVLQNWEKYLELAKEQKRICVRLGDAGKISDALLNVGQAYYNSCLYDKAKKWHLKSHDVSKRAQILEGQFTSKIECGNALDANDEWEAAVSAYEQAYLLASQENTKTMVKHQKTALENMQYVYNLRMHDFNQAREIERRILSLKTLHAFDEEEELCSETNSEKELDEATSDVRDGTRSSRKRHRIVLSDDEEEQVSFRTSNVTPGSPQVITIPAPSSSGNSGSLKACSKRANLKEAENVLQTPQETASTRDEGHFKPNESSKSSGTVPKGRDGGAVQMDLEGDFDAPCSSVQAMPVSVNGVNIVLDLKDPQRVTVSWVLEELLREYKRTKPEGPHPILKELVIRNVSVSSSSVYVELIKARPEDISVVIAGWIYVPFFERYQLQCVKYNFQPKLEIMNNLKVEDGEVNASHCDFDDVSVWPLVLALESLDTIFSVKLAHNRLGSTTVNALQGLLKKTKNMSIGLAVDLHDNKLGANALFEICKCEITLSRLEVLNLSNNALTDRIGHDLAFLVEHASRLQVLELENCCLTTPTFESLRDSIPAQSRLRKLCIGKNNPVAGYALKGLLEKIASLPSFTEIDLSDLRLNRTGVDGVTSLVTNSSTLSVLVLKQNQFRPECWDLICDAIRKKTPELTSLDLMDCKILPELSPRVYELMLAIPTLSSLNLSGNIVTPLGVELLAEELKKPTSNLQKLHISRCSLSLNDVLAILRALQANRSLIELNLSGNCGDYQAPAIVADSEDEDDGNDSRNVVVNMTQVISGAAGLKFLDLSDIGLAAADETIDELYQSWSSSRRGAERHAGDGLVHFCVEGMECCSSRSCC